MMIVKTLIKFIIPYYAKFQLNTKLFNIARDVTHYSHKSSGKLVLNYLSLPFHAQLHARGGKKVWWHFPPLHNRQMEFPSNIRKLSFFWYWYFKRRIIYLCLQDPSCMKDGVKRRWDTPIGGVMLGFHLSLNIRLNGVICL